MTSRAAMVGLAALMSATGCIYREDPPLQDLFPGDVTGVVRGTAPGSTSDGPLGGARVQLRRASLARVTASDGRFVLRSLPEGTHALLITYDPNQDLVPDLARQLPVRIRIPSGRSSRPSLDLGTITLLRPGTIHGHISGAVPADLSQVVVAVVGAGLSVHVDGSGNFRIEGLGPSLADVPDTQWSVVAGAPGAMSNVVTVAVEENGNHQVDLVLAPLPANPVDVTVTLDVDVAPEPEGSPGALLGSLLSAPAAYAFSPDGTLVKEINRTGTSYLMQVVPGLYDFVVDEGVDFVPVYAGLLAVGPDGLQYSALALRRAGERCEDQDGDGRCALPSGQEDRCLQPCASGATCDVDGTAYDCDDDADGQSDPDERLACRCAPAPDPQAPCDGDALRQDINHNGVCDRFEPRPAASASTSSSSSSSAGGSSSSSGGPSSSAGTSSTSSSTSSSSSSSTSSSGGTGCVATLPSLGPQLYTTFPQANPTFVAALEPGTGLGTLFFVDGANPLHGCDTMVGSCAGTTVYAVPDDLSGPAQINGLTVALDAAMTGPAVIVSTQDGIRECSRFPCGSAANWSLAPLTGALHVRAFNGQYYWLEPGGIYTCAAADCVAPALHLPAPSGAAMRDFAITSLGALWLLDTDNAIHVDTGNGEMLVDFGCMRQGMIMGIAVTDRVPARLWVLEMDSPTQMRVAYCDRNMALPGFVCEAWGDVANGIEEARELQAIYSEATVPDIGVTWAQGPAGAAFISRVVVPGP